MESLVVRDAAADDAAALVRIYNHYIRETVITFEEDTIDAAEMERRIGDLVGADFPWLVATANGDVCGYAYAGTWRTRAAYRYSVEATVYLDPDRCGQGVGTRLYDELLERLAARGVHAIVGGIALPNPASVALHEKLGFRKVAHFEAVGFKFGRWVDVGYWQIVLGD